EPPGTRNSSSDSVGVFAATDSPTRRLHLVRFFDRVIADDHRLRCEHPDGVLYTGKHTQAGRETKPVRGSRFQVSGFRFQVSGFRFQVSGAHTSLTDGARSLYREWSFHIRLLRENEL